jgi:hypothetical protein
MYTNIYDRQEIEDQRQIIAHLQRNQDAFDEKIKQNEMKVIDVKIEVER